MNNFAKAQSGTFVMSELPKVLNESGDTMHMAFLGGFNQPQFWSLDIDNDGTRDIVVFDRTGEKVVSLISTTGGSYRYAPEFDHIFPRFSSWVVFKDYNADGKEDIWFKNVDENAISLYRNITQSGDPHARFEPAVISLRAFNFGQLIDTSDLYCDNANIPAIEDVDGDGDIDFLTLQTNGFGVTLFLNNTVENNKPLDPPSFEEVDVCWGDFTEGTEDNAIYLERYRFCYRKIYRYEKKHAGGSSMLLIDGDDDGDKDLILGNAGFTNLIYLENGKSDLGRVMDSMIAFDPRFPSYNIPARVRSFPAAFYLDVDRDGKRDLLVAPNLTDKFSGRIEEFNNIRFYKNTGTEPLPYFEQEDSSWLNDQFIDHGNHTAPLLYDIDKDGDMDMILATNQGHHLTMDRHDALYLYENIGTRNKPVFQLVSKDFLGLNKDSITGMYPTIGDLNNDGQPELLIGNYAGTLHLYGLSGSGKSMTANKIADNAFNISVSFNSTPHIADVDGDGIDDLLLGCEGGHVYYYNNQPQNNVAKLSLVTDSLGGVVVNELRVTVYYDPVKDIFIDTMLPLPFGFSAPFLADLDNNGNPELICGGASGYLNVYSNIRNNLNGKFNEFRYSQYDPARKLCYRYDAGADAHPAVADLNGDGRQDIIISNNRGGINFMLHVGDACTAGTGDDFTGPVNEFKVYPNPTSTILKLHSSFFGSRSYRVYSITGQQVLEGITQGDEIDVRSLNQGIYIVEIAFGRERLRARFVKH
ncbi:MAG: T9SS type A sorting domain-containing protein [Flavobacteriales bacterium]|nr:T9SS type A sorting domain-containing protein [Flavobacteriales bacterium]